MAIFKQTALSISKSGNVLTMTWKLADFYDSQETYWSIDGQKVLTTLDGNFRASTMPEKQKPVARR